jgi:glycosyltransferase involved in cell wall biosynthesis
MKKVRIAIIAHSCRSGGGLVVTRNFLESLKNVVQNEKFLIIFPAGYSYEQIKLPLSSEVFVYRGSHSFWARVKFEFFVLPRIVDRFRPSVILGFGNTALVNPHVPQALFVHQAKVFYGEKYYQYETLRNRLRLCFLRWQIAKSLPKTDIVFCQTSIVSKRFSEKFDYPLEQTRVLKFPVPSELETSEIPGKTVPAKNSFDGFRVFVLTNYSAHRNPHILVPLCRRFSAKLCESKIEFITTVESDDHPKAKKFLNDIEEYSLSGFIHNVGRLSRKQVVAYYHNCQLLWLPTMLETLGIPYLEAMKTGIAIFAPDLDFARYVCGSAAIYYNPWDIDDIFRKLMLVRENERLRMDLIAEGAKELLDESKFSKSWDSLAADVLRELKSLVKNNFEVY